MAKTVNIAVAGALGRMGRAVLKACATAQGVRVSGTWDRPAHPQIGQDVGLAAGLAELGVPLSGGAAEGLRGADAVIDFSLPQASLATLKAALAQRRRPAVVLGTTGLSAGQLRAVARAARRLPLIHASNFSVGVNLLWKLIADAAKVTGLDYDVEIIDVHHHHKKDSPSGTAMTTAQVLARALGQDPRRALVFGRKTRDGRRRPGEIGIHALRAGDVVGDHTVLFAGPAERLELTHRAHSRDNFAGGALRAALWLVKGGKRAGAYRMAQVLGLG